MEANVALPNRIQWMARSYKLIKKHDKIILTSEIAAAILKKENISINNDADRKVHIAPLSTALRKLVKAGDLRRGSKIGMRTFFYGLPEWFDESGAVKQEYDVDFFED